MGRLGRNLRERASDFGSRQQLRAGEFEAINKAVGIIFSGLEKSTVEEDDLDLCLRWFWWSLAMIPLCYVVLMLIGGWKEATSSSKRLGRLRGT